MPGIVERREFGADFDRLAYTEEVVEPLEDPPRDLVAMAGFMTILGPGVHGVPGADHQHPPVAAAGLQGRARRRDALAAA